MGEKKNIESKDGYEEFLNLIHVKEEQFIEWGVKEYKMPSKDIVAEEWNELKKRIEKNMYKEEIKKDEQVYIRKYGGNEKSNQFYKDFYSSVFNINIKTDPTNNNEPQKLINRLVTKPNGVKYINYQISHVWGKTKNMYMFTAPWNIMLIPKMFDPLTGHEANGKLPDKFKAALRKKIYNEYRDIIVDYNNIIWNVYLNNNNRKEKCNNCYNKIKGGINPKGTLGGITRKMYENFKDSVDNEFIMIDTNGETTLNRDKVIITTKEKYNNLVHFVKDKSILNPPLLTYTNYDNWKHKATLARLLTTGGLNYSQEAIELFRDAIAVPLDEKSPDILDDIDLRAWALRDLSILESQQGDNEQALQHIEQAIDLAESRTDNYQFTIRGNLLMHKFLILCELGQAQEAEALADDMIERYKNAGSKNNSYVFYGNQCKAKLAAKRGKHAEVKEFMLKALEALDNTNEAVAASRTALLSINTAGASAMDLFKEMQQALPDAYHEIVYWDTNCFQDKR